MDAHPLISSADFDQMPYNLQGGFMTSDEATAVWRLSLDQAVTICRGFARCGPEVFQYMEHLQQNGFQAFLPYEDFVSSFATTQEEIELHRQSLVELPQIILGTPWPLQLVSGGRDVEFRTPLLRALLARHEAEDDPNNRMPVNWSVELDPCNVRLTSLQFQDRDVYDRLWAGVVAAVQSRFREETALKATKLAQVGTFDLNGRYALFVAAMERDASELGFQFDKRRSRMRFPVFSKRVCESWDLCWAIERPYLFFFNDVEGCFQPELQLRHRDLKGGVNTANAGEYLVIRHSAMVPGFFQAYQDFSNLGELETLIKVHLCLYDLMRPVIESTIKTVLG